jgi:thiol-disulfide isomerase/thioredoxin
MQSRRSLLPQLLAAGAFAAGFLPAVRGAAQPDRAAAPEFIGIDGCLNTAALLALAGLRGKVVLVNFWTYSCINCRRTVPYVNRWQAEYGAQGLQAVGIHTPEFGFEHTPHNVADAAGEFGIRYPVGQDNAFRTWRAWGATRWGPPSICWTGAAGSPWFARAKAMRASWKARSAPCSASRPLAA